MMRHYKDWAEVLGVSPEKMLDILSSGDYERGSNGYYSLSPEQVVCLCSAVEDKPQPLCASEPLPESVSLQEIEFNGLPYCLGMEAFSHAISTYFPQSFNFYLCINAIDMPNASRIKNMVEAINNVSVEVLVCAGMPPGRWAITCTATHKTLTVPYSMD